VLESYYKVDHNCIKLLPKHGLGLLYPEKSTAKHWQTWSNSVLWSTPCRNTKRKPQTYCKSM